MRKLLLSLFAVFFVVVSFSQQFEGELRYVKISFTDTLYYVYTIKGNVVRIDEFDKYQRANRSYIIDTKSKSLMVMNPNKLVYTKLETLFASAPMIKDMEVVNTGNFKFINGYKCSQWRVKNATENTEFSYWLAGDNFSFYAPMSYVAMSIEDMFLFFNALPENQMSGTVPFLVESRTLLRAPKSTISLMEIRQHPVDKEVFNLAHYQRYESLQ